MSVSELNLKKALKRILRFFDLFKDEKNNKKVASVTALFTVNYKALFLVFCKVMIFQNKIK